MIAEITAPAVVLAAFVRHPVRLPDGRALYVLVTGCGRFFSVAAPEIFDASGAPITLPAELAPGSIVRVAARAGQMRAIQVIEARFINPFSAEAPP